MTEQMLDSSRIDPGTVQTARESLPPLVKPPLSANWMMLAGDVFLLSPSCTVPAIQSNPESKLLEIAEEMSVRLPIRIWEEQVIGAVDRAPLF
jgi:hypothetical protein